MHGLIVCKHSRLCSNSFGTINWRSVNLTCACSILWDIMILINTGSVHQSICISLQYASVHTNTYYTYIMHVCTWRIVDIKTSSSIHTYNRVKSGNNGIREVGLWVFRKRGYYFHVRYFFFYIHIFNATSRELIVENASDYWI